jgi:putative sigma-54 modulation protein
MKIIIKATNIELTPAIKNYVDKKIKLLNKYIKEFEKSTELIFNIEIGKETKHHHKGDVFRSEINLKIGKHFLRAEERSENLYTSIDLTKDKIHNQIIKLKEKTEEKNK